MIRSIRVFLLQSPAEGNAGPIAAISPEFAMLHDRKGCAAKTQNQPEPFNTVKVTFELIYSMSNQRREAGGAKLTAKALRISHLNFAVAIWLRSSESLQRSSIDGAQMGVIHSITDGRFF